MSSQDPVWQQACPLDARSLLAASSCPHPTHRSRETGPKRRVYPATDPGEDGMRQPKAAATTLLVSRGITRRETSQAYPLSPYLPNSTELSRGLCRRGDARIGALLRVDVSFTNSPDPWHRALLDTRDRPGQTRYPCQIAWSSDAPYRFRRVRCLESNAMFERFAMTLLSGSLL